MGRKSVRIVRYNQTVIPPVTAV